MKKIKWLSLLTIGPILFILFSQSCAFMPSNKTEQQKHTVVQMYEGFEIRFYPSATIATINSNAKTYRELASPGFRKLAGYIFGGNETDEKISMTAPVHMDINDSTSKMSFVMPSAYIKENLPKPNDPSVTIHKTSDEYVAAIKFGGYASDENIKTYSEKLQNLLNEKNIASYGNYRFYGYNPPYQFINRRNEIVVAIEWNK